VLPDPPPVDDLGGASVVLVLGEDLAGTGAAGTEDADGDADGDEEAAGVEVDEVDAGVVRDPQITD
jgi:hypothetical protein